MQKKTIFALTLVFGLISAATASTGVTCRDGAGRLNGTDHFDWTQNYGGDGPRSRTAPPRLR